MLTVILQVLPSLIVFPLLWLLWQNKKHSKQQQTNERTPIEHMQQTLLQQLNTLQQTMHQQATDQQKNLHQLEQKTQHTLHNMHDKTQHIFKDVHTQLASINVAQKQLNQLSDDVSSNLGDLQKLFLDKRSRGVIGEVQLMALVENTMPSNSFTLQYTLSNHKRADCVLFLPPPTGLIVIDAKFPLENYRRMHQDTLNPSDRGLYQKQFKVDIRKHIHDIAEKYIIPGETSEGALMFIPAEAIFADIHANHPDLIQTANQARVWIVSPTTIMAVLTTAYAVLKDANTREQVSTIQTLLISLAKDFQRFQKRMDNMSRHARRLNQDIDEIDQSSRKITRQFEKIERVELPAQPIKALAETED